MKDTARDSGRDSERGALRVLVVDDSAYNRQTIATMIQAIPGATVVGRASDGKEALKLVFERDPDVVTLDLEMPEMDGFAFLRLLMSCRPLPVIVISGHAEQENVFRALEIGALDFIAKRRNRGRLGLLSIQQEISEKIAFVRRLQVVRLRDRAESLAAQRGGAIESQRLAMRGQKSKTSVVDLTEPASVIIAIGASTGGPPAIQQLLKNLPDTLPAAIVIAQHMPDRFTSTFARRLDRMLSVRVIEARDGQPLENGFVYIAPGAANVNLVQGSDDVIRIEIIRQNVPEGETAGLAPSVDKLFDTVSQYFSDHCCAVVLTGMGSDGTLGARRVVSRGGQVFAEDPATAVMPGMPKSVVEAGVCAEVLPLEKLHEAIVRFVRSVPKKRP